MTQEILRNPGGIRFSWQEQIAGSGLQEVLELARQFRDSGLFDENELSAMQEELKGLAVLLAEGLIKRITEGALDTSPPAAVREKLDLQASEVRRKLNKVGESLSKIS